MADATYVIDTEPLIALLYEEPGYDVVEHVLARIETGDAAGLFAAVTTSELLYKVARIEADRGLALDEAVSVAARDVRVFERRWLPIEHASWRLAGEIKAHGGLSVANAHAVALAVEHDATLLVGADEDFDALPVDVATERIRDEGV